MVFWIVLALLGFFVSAFLLFAISRAASMAEHSAIGAETQLEDESRKIALAYIDNPPKKATFPAHHGVAAPSSMTKKPEQPKNKSDKTIL